MKITVIALEVVASTLVRALEELAQRYEVEVVVLEHPGRVARLHHSSVPAGVKVRRLVLSEHRGRLAERLARSRYFPADAAVLDELASIADGSAWVWLEGVPLAWTPELKRRLPRAFVTWSEDAGSLAALRAARVYAVTRPPRAMARLIAGVVHLYDERRFMSGLDVVIARSPGDASWLRRRARATVAPLVHAVDLAPFDGCMDTRPDDAVGPVVAFVGSNYEPNRHGLRWFLRRVWPQLHSRRPDARLRIAGYDLTPEVLGPLPSGVELVGETPSVPAFLVASRVVICPIFYGAGLPSKVLEAGASARPTLITPYVARAMGGGDGLTVAARPSAWIEHLAGWLDDAAAARADGERARQRIERDFGRDRWREALSSLEHRAGG